MYSNNKSFNFISMTRMLKILVIVMLSSLAAKSQIYSYPNTSYGVQWKRIKSDSTLLFATYCGVPVGTDGLHSINLHMSAIYYDSCGHHGYLFDPSDSSWTMIGASKLNDSTVIIGRDTITVSGGGADNGIAAGSRTATGDYIQDWANHWFFLHDLKALE
jgi:hypothetical protein